jgi:hypothetical protein
MQLTKVIQTLYNYTYSRFIAEGVAEVSQIFLRDVSDLIGADVGSKPIAPSPSGRSLFQVQVQNL